MARPKEAEDLLRTGLCPSDIASKMGISITSVFTYLQTRIGEGSLRISDIYFSYPDDRRHALQYALDNPYRGEYLDSEYLVKNGLSREEAEFFRNRREFSGDMYEHISTIEKHLHGLVRDMLQSKHGDAESGWWRKGIPVKIRNKCVTRREEDDQPCSSPYAYTDFIDLSEIIKENWSLFSDRFPKAYRNQVKLLKTDFVRLNNIRNAVMHPAKERKWTEDEFMFVKNFRKLLIPERTR